MDGIGRGRWPKVPLSGVSQLSAAGPQAAICRLPFGRSGTLLGADEWNGSVEADRAEAEGGAVPRRALRSGECSGRGSGGCRAGALSKREGARHISRSAIPGGLRARCLGRYVERYTQRARRQGALPKVERAPSRICRRSALPDAQRATWTLPERGQVERSGNHPKSRVEKPSESVLAKSFGPTPNGGRRTLPSAPSPDPRRAL